jgi:hypothetical protein
MRRVWVVASFALLVLPVAAMAQRGAGMRGGGMVAVRSTTIVAPHAAVSGPHIVLRASTGSRSGATVVRRRPGGTIIRNVNGSSRLNNVSVFSTMNVPGLGFDYPHLAAVTSGHGRGRSGIGQGGAFGFGGFLLLLPTVAKRNASIFPEPTLRQNRPRMTRSMFLCGAMAGCCLRWGIRGRTEHCGMSPARDCGRVLRRICWIWTRRSSLMSSAV